MKSILLSIRPEWVAKILNGEKTIEIRKKFPKDYVGWVYIYCTKDKKQLVKFGNEWDTIITIRRPKVKSIRNGKVVARFWCDKVEEFIYSYSGDIYVTDLTGSNGEFDILIKSGLYRQQLYEYTKFKPFYAIHISKLEVFDKPLYLDDFTRPAKCRHCEECEHKNNKICDKGFVKMFDKAPQNYCYVESEEK